MKSLFSSLLFKKFLKDESGSPAIEAAFLFPIMVTLLCGVVDTGIGLIVNMKVTNASQVVSDLVSRETTITAGEINDAIVAGRLAIMPYDTTTYGVDIAGIQFIGTTKTPTVMWRNTQNMSPNQKVTTHSADLGAQNEGVIAVSVRYVYTPYFASFILNPIIMEEEAYVRGRKGLFITRV